MNERIREFERQCWQNREDGLFPGQAHFDADKFARLIVRECMDICLGDDGEDQQGWGKFFAQKIRLQLGVA